MTRSELQDFGENEPIWGFIAQLGRERFTGQAEVGVQTRVELFATEGRLYFAQKPDDPPLGARFVATGVLTTEQLRNGSVKVGDTVSLARLFSRVPELDRDAVELMADRFTQQVLEAVSTQPVGSVTLRPLRHHPSGIQQWYADAEPDEAPGPQPAMDALVADVVALVSGEVPVVAAIAEVEPEPEAVVEPELEPEPEPEPATMTFEPVVSVPVEAAAALPTLSTLSGLTPLPTLGEVGTRMPTPTMVHTPAPMAADGLPSLGRVGVSFHPNAVNGEPPDDGNDHGHDDGHDDGPQDPTVAELEAMMAGEAPDPQPRNTSAVTVLEPGSPLPPPVVPPGLSPLDLPSFSAMTTPAAPAPNAVGAPVAQETEQIWDMVDDLLGLPHSDGAAADGNSPESDKKGRGWLRGRRG